MSHGLRVHIDKQLYGNRNFANLRLVPGRKDDIPSLGEFQIQTTTVNNSTCIFAFRSFAPCGGEILTKILQIFIVAQKYRNLCIFMKSSLIVPPKSTLLLSFNICTLKN